jgi:hypothetical protein
MFHHSGRVASCPIGSFFFPVLLSALWLNPASRFTAHPVDLLFSWPVHSFFRLSFPTIQLDDFPIVWKRMLQSAQFIY